MISYLAVFVLGLVCGIVVVVGGVWYVLSAFLYDPDSKKDNASKPAHVSPSTFQLPPVLLSKINDESCKSKESCWALNFVLYFLFRELRNSEPIRRWILRKLSLEFEELLATTVLGKFFSSISIHNIDFGQNFPVVNWMKTSSVELHPVFKSISTLDILVDLDYSGGFQFSIQAETHLKHHAFLSVQFNRLRGQARLQFSIEPYAHWSFSFVENPDIDIAVVSHLYGKSFNQITSIISNQLKRSVRKKHTLPMFKIRYKPFFHRVEHILAALVPESAPPADSKGAFEVTLIECRGLMSSLIHGNIYAHVSVGDFNWVAAHAENSHVFLVLDVVCVKTAKREVSLDFTLIQHNDVPIVEAVNTARSKQTTHEACVRLMELAPGDEIIAVDGKLVSTTKQCIRNFRNSSSMKVVWRVRRRYPIFNALDAIETSNGTEPAAAAAATTTSATTTTTTSTTTTCPEIKKSSKLGVDCGDTTSMTHSRRSSDETPEKVATENPRSFAFKSSYNLAGNGSVQQVYRTGDFPSTKDPIFLESFNFNVEEPHRYVNLTIWSSVRAKTPAGSSNSSSPTSSPAKKSNKREVDELFPYCQDSVVGVLSVPLSDIISECSTTGMGYFVKDYYLASPDGNAMAARELGLKDHSGFEPHMCYGKITVSFLYKPTDENGKRKDSAESSSSSVLPIETATEATVESTKLSPSEDTQPHQFVRTHFRIATACDYCNKKIWLKEAYLCCMCNMKCHKKCHERCMANTVCKGPPELRYGGNRKASVTPEIITTESEPTKVSNGECDDDEEPVKQHLTADNSSSTVRRRTLGGLIVSAVQNRSAQLRRAGSATNLLPPSLNPNSSSRSLPQSPQASPTHSRKASVASGSSGFICGSNPFESLDSVDAEGMGISADDLNAAVEHLIQHSNDDDLVSLAKETGRDVFCNLSLADRKQKLNHVLNRLQEEIDLVTNERLALTKEESTAVSSSSKSLASHQAIKCEERVQALALLMLHFCAGLQHVQDLEEKERDARKGQPSDEDSTDFTGAISP